MNKRNLFLLCVLGAAFILSGTSSAADIYVSTAGSDDNDGLSWDTPKATIRNATLTASSGDSIWLADGEYTGDDNRGITIDRNLTLTGQSTTGTVINCGYLSRAFHCSGRCYFPPEEPHSEKGVMTPMAEPYLTKASSPLKTVCSPRTQGTTVLL